MTTAVETLKIETAPALVPLIGPARDKAAHGGRGSMKSHFFAGQMCKYAFRQQGFRGVCIREVQKSLKESAKHLIETKIEAFKLRGFRVLNDEIVTPGKGVIIFQGMTDHTAESIKSLEAFDISWVEEAQTFSERSLMMLRPTIRKPGSERWWSWNPRRKADPVDQLFRGQNPAVKQWQRPPNAVVLETNWRDNPWWTEELEQDRVYDKINNPETYEHVWEGDYVGVSKGAYFAQQLAQAKRDNRITKVTRDPMMTTLAIWDIGGTGARADARSIWVAQFIGRAINVIDYRESQGQPLAEDVAWLRTSGYDKCHCILPHDGATFDTVFPVSPESALKSAGFKTQVVKNQGAGAASLRIEAARRLFPRIWFDAEKTEAGRAALAWYHPKIDAQREIDLGPDHDWSSHAADAFGLMCVAYEEPRVTKEAPRGSVFTVQDEQGLGWLAN